MNASLVDGSTLMQRVRYIILPLLRWPLLGFILAQIYAATGFASIILLVVPLGALACGLVAGAGGFIGLALSRMRPTPVGVPNFVPRSKPSATPHRNGTTMPTGGTITRTALAASRTATGVSPMISPSACTGSGLSSVSIVTASRTLRWTCTGT